MKEALRKLRAKATLTIMSKGIKIGNENIIEIPENWEKFGDGEWIKLNMPDPVNVTSCLYRGYKDGKFIPHKHNNHSEHLTVLNETGEIEVITDEFVRIIKYPESVLIPKGMPHGVNFLTETLLQVNWRPKKTNFEAEFIKY